MPYILRDRREAGQLLAKQLATFAEREDCLVMALPRGGVVVAFEIARELHLPLDVCVVRKLGVPFHPEVAMGAIAFGDVVILNEAVINDLGITYEEINHEVAMERGELRRREIAYRGGRPLTSLKGKTVILVDDGIATGATIEASIEAMRRLGVEHIVVATGVAPPSTLRRISRVVDRVICVLQPQNLAAVAQWYEDFTQTSDQEVCDLLQQASALQAARSSTAIVHAR